ncbi:MAG: leucyl aminopeptidase [Chloroflexota bacterium]
MNPISVDVIRSANLIVRRLLAIKPGEQVAIVCDPHSPMEMAYALAGEAESVGAEWTILMQPTRDATSKNRLTPVIEHGLAGADCLIGMTGSSGAPTYATAVKRLYHAKTLRGMSMVMRSLDNYTQGAALADYDTLYTEGQKLAAVWRSGEMMHITTPAGTDIRAPIANDDVIIECGFAVNPGEEAAFSDGEVSSRPVESKAEGVIVVDGPIAHIGMPASPIVVHVLAGRVTSIDGDSPQADALRHIVQSVQDADNIAEFGIGLNPASRRNGDFEEEKKARGLVHIAIGDNIFYGGTTQCAVHMDMVLYRPTVRLDERSLVRAGVVQMEDM